MLFQPLPWACWVDSTHGVEMEPSAHSSTPFWNQQPPHPPPTHASPRKTSNKTELQSSHISHKHMWAFLTQGSWHGGPQSSRTGIPAAGLETLSLEPHWQLWNDSTKRSVSDFHLAVLCELNPEPEDWGLECFAISPCTGTGIMYWELWISQLTRTGKHCMLVRNKGTATSICVHICRFVAGLPYRPWLSAACSCLFIALCKTWQKTSLCVGLACLFYA